MRRHTHLFQKIHCGRVKRAGKQIHAQIIRHLLELGLPFPWGVGLAVEIVQRTAIPQGASTDAEVFPVAGDGDGVGGVGLQFHRIRPRLLGGVDNAHRLFEILVVICRELCDHVDGSAVTNRAIADLYLRRHRALHAGRMDRTSSNASAAGHPATLPHRVAMARSASGDRGCGNSRLSES